MCENQVFYLNGNRDSEYSIVEGSRLYDFLSRNYFNEFDCEGNESLVVTGDVLDAILDCGVEFSDSESVLIGFMVFHVDYVGGFIFS